MKSKIYMIIVGLIVGFIAGIFVVFDGGLLVALSILFAVVGVAFRFYGMSEMAWMFWLIIPVLIGLGLPGWLL